MSAPSPRLYLLSWVLVLDLLGGAGLKRWLWSWRREPPARREVCISGNDAELAADFYFYPHRSNTAAILLTHGVIESGKADPRLIHFAECLVRCGFSVLIPELKKMKSLTLVMEESQDIVKAFRFMVALDGVDKERAGLMSFSFGAGPTLGAAADPMIREQVKFVIAFGGYFDPVNVIRYVTTGFDRYQGHVHTQEPDAYGKEVFVRNIVRNAADVHDRTVLEELFRDPTQKRNAGSDGIGELTNGGRALYDLMVNEDDAAVEGLIERTDTTVKAYLESLSLAGKVDDIKARVFIGHGDTDNLMPSTESLRLAAALPPQRVGYVAVLKMIGHVDPNKSKISVREFLTVSLPALLHFHGLIRRILEQQR